MYRPGSDPYTSGNVAPRRFGGTETEFDTQQLGETPGHVLDATLITYGNLAQAGITGWQCGNTLWLPPGCNLHLDVGRVEYSSGEGASAEELAAGNLAGMSIVTRLARARGAFVYRHSGTVVQVWANGGLKKQYGSLGYHQNLSTSGQAATQELADLWDTHMATRIWAWGGMVGMNGFELCQKARGMGSPTLFRMGSRTTEGAKPMGWIKVGDTDVYRPTHEGRSARSARVEGRVVDGGFSRWSAWMQEAAGSLALRIAERKDILGRKHSLDRLRLVDAVDTLHRTSLDLTLSVTHKTRAGEALTAIDLNELMGEYGDYLRQRVELPAAEYRAVDELFDIATRLRQTDLLSGYVEPIKYRVDFAPRLAFLLKYFPLHRLHAGNEDAVKRSRSWSRAEPEGPGLKFWKLVLANGKAPDPLGDDLIEHYTAHPSVMTRAAVRGAAIEEGYYRRRLESISWPYLHLRNGNTIWLDPEDNDPSILQRRIG